MSSDSDREPVYTGMSCWAFWGMLCVIAAVLYIAWGA